MPSTPGILWRSYVIVAGTLGAWLLTAIVLGEPLRWLHDANGTFPLVQAPINAIITFGTAAVIGSVIYRGLVRRRTAVAARMTESPTVTDATPSEALTPTPHPAHVETAKAGVATTR